MYGHEIAPLNVCFSNEQADVLGFKQFDLNYFEIIECWNCEWLLKWS